MSSHALRTLRRRQWNKPKRLPLAADVKKLNDHVSSKAEFNSNILRASPDDTHTWNELAKATLVTVMLFNRRRSGEIQRIPFQSYQNSSISVDSDIYECLSEWEKALCSKLRRIEVRGKRGRKVPVLLSETVCGYIDLLAKTRTAVGVCEKNEYLFACHFNGSVNALRGAACLRNMANDCNLQRPADITSTNFRKQVATMAQVLTLRENEMDILAGFMGHDIRIHREFYRLPEDILQVAKVSKILIAMDRGDMGKFYGKSLDDIQLNDDGMKYCINMSLFAIN